MAKENGVANKLILGFVMLMIGAILIGVIANQTNARTTANSNAVSNEVHKVLSPYAAGGNLTAINPAITYTTTNLQAGWRTADCPLTNFVLSNSSGAVLAEGASNGYVLNAAAGTWYLRDTAGTLVNVMGDGSSNNTYVSYNYCSDEYLNSSWGRSVLSLVSGFFAIALLMVALALFYSVAKDTGIL